MMKHIRRASALLLCLLLICTASASLAATKKLTKTFTTVPTVTLKLPKEVESGGPDDLTVTANIPGFITIRILDENGNVAATPFSNYEIHSKENDLDFYGSDDDGFPLEPGKYSISADLVSQFGVASKTVSKNTVIIENEDTRIADLRKAGKAAYLSSLNAQEQAADSTAAAATAPTTTSSTTTASTTTSSTTTTSTTPASAPAASTTASKTSSSDMTYATGTYAMGDEGLLIGVGVDDTAAQDDAGFWTLTAEATDEELWAAITRKMTGVDVGEAESAYIYDSVEAGRKKIGTVSGISQGLNVIKERDDGWALVETFRNEDGAFVRGYIKSNKLRPVEPNPDYGIVIDKNTQTLTVFKAGQRLGSCKVSTGLPTGKYPHRETPAGEFITVTRRGAYEYYGMGYTRYTIRINGNYYLCEIPTGKKNGTTYLKDVSDYLGSKITRGNICIAHDASTDGGINAEWIWKMTDANKRVKVLILDDKPRSDVPVSTK